MTKLKVVLKLGKEKAILNRHHWIFSGAVAQLPTFENGALLPVYSHGGALLGTAYFNRCSTIVGRMIAFDETAPLLAIEQRLQQAFDLRQTLFDPSITNAYRLINAEGDGIPGLIVDVYDTVLSIQINTCGIERMRDFLISLLVEKLKPQAIFEKSISSARKQEGLLPTQGFVYGTSPDEIRVLENGIAFQVALEKGQKTGFFLDQREMRQLISRLAKGKRVLNCFSYSGGFSIYALKAGACHVTSIDCNEDALRLAKINTEINGLDLKNHEIQQADVFEYLRNTPLAFDLAVLDPPAFAKKKNDIIAACAGYKEINRLCFEKLPPKSFLLTSSCSHMIDPELFQNVVFQAALDAGRDVQIVSGHIQAADHPISLMHPEGLYLKSLLIYIN